MGKLNHNLNFEFSMLAFIDIVFLTLIFIVITFRIEEPKKAILLDVPTVNSATNTLIQPPNALLIQISKDNNLYFNGGEIDIPKLESIVLDFKEKGGKKIILECDKSSTLEIFSRVISLLASHNITEYSLVVKEFQNE